jgi:hypothetical protein
MTTPVSGAGWERLAAYRRCVERIGAAWPEFRQARDERLRQGLFGAPAEKVAENILEDLFTSVLDWPREGVNPQIRRADFVLTDLGFKYAVVEVKRPGTLAWRQRSLDDALVQAQRYALEQQVAVVVVSDGALLYAADVVADVAPGSGGRLRARACVDLAASEPPASLWWISRHGIYRPCPLAELPAPSEAGPAGERGDAEGAEGALLHRKYQLPAHCFAYVADPGEPATWKLPYLLADGSPDLRRLPKAIQAILSNYRGARVTIPREAVPDVLVTLGRATSRLGRMPCQDPATAPAYAEVHVALAQMGRLGEVGCCGP